MLFDLFGYQFHIFEIPLLIFLMSYFIIQFVLEKGRIINEIDEDKKYFHLFLMGFFLLFVSKIISFWPAMDKTLVISDLLKWVEIFAFVILIFNFKYFKYIYWILFLVHFFPVLISVFFSILNLNFFSGYRVLLGYPSIFSLSLLLPFSKKNYLIGFTCIILIITNILSITRGAWLALIVSLSYYILIHFRENKKYILKMVGIIVIIILILINIPGVQNNINKRAINPFLTYSESNYQRSGMIALCMEIFRKNPIIGIGSGNFGKYAAENPYFYLGRYLEIPENMAPHAFFLQLLAENGIFGFIAMVMIFLILIKVLFEEKRYLKYRNGKEYILGLRMSCLSFMIHLIFGFVAGSNRLIFGLLMGLSLSLLKKNHSIDSIKI
ncbi:MAG: O-antigen ligase family protein [Candidatus Thermoplasmatota archaeon]|nr:O-antigen ligase family protein [Candidatus Thermoplasmatota archaeon]